MERILLTIMALLSVDFVEANSCCGQSPTSYTVLYQRQKTMLSVGYSSIETQGRVFSNQDFFVWPDNKRRQVDVYQFQGAFTLTEWSQMFWSTGLLSSSFEQGLGTERSQHLSDTQMGFTYELLPEYSYSPWKPVLYASVFINAPTGRSIYAPGGMSEGADVTGHDQWGAGVGLTVRKVIHPVALVVQTKALRLFEETFSGTTVSGFYDLSMGGFATYNLPFWGLSGTLGWTWNQLSSRRISVSPVPSGDSQVGTLSVSLQKAFSDETSVALSYADQSLLGKAQNTLLNQTITLNLNYNFL